MNKQNVVNAHNEILFGLKKEGNSDSWYNMDEHVKDIILREIRQSKKWQTQYDYSWDIFRVAYSQRQKVEWWLAGTGREVFLHVQSFSFTRWKVLEMDCAAMGMYFNTTELYT